METRALFGFWGKKGTAVNFGHLVALLVLGAAFVLWLVGQMDVREALMFIGLAVAILVSPFPIRWTPPA